MITALRWYERLWRRVNKASYTVAIVCDRCGRRILGRPPEDGMTAGYYHNWTHITDPGEVDVCDPCMWSDERYTSVYGIPLEAIGENGDGQD